MLTYGDLKDQIGTKGIWPVLHCPACGEDASGNAGDYFMANPKTVIRCCCGEPMVLAELYTAYKTIKQ